MEVKPRENTYESSEHASVRGDGDEEGDVVSDDPFSEWRAQHTAFGAVLVAYAFLMSLVPLVARYPEEANQMIFALLQAIVDWRIWVLVVTSLCLMAILMIALKRRQKTAGGA